MRRAAALQAAEAHRAPRITAAHSDGQDPAVGAARAPRWHALTRGRVLRTPLCDLLGIELPIVAAPMGPSISGPELAAAVSNAGGLGIVAFGADPPPLLPRPLAPEGALTARP